RPRDRLRDCRVCGRPPECPIAPRPAPPAVKPPAVQPHLVEPRPPAALRLPPTRRYLVVTAAGRAGTGRYLQDQRGWAVAGEALHCEGFTSGGRGAGTARPPLRGRTHWAAPAHPAVSEPG